MRAIHVVLVLGLATGASAGSHTDPVAAAQVKIDAGDFEGALEILEPLLAKQPDYIPARMAAATARLGWHDPTTALEHLNSVPELDPGPPGLHWLRGQALFGTSSLLAAEGRSEKARSYASDAADELAKALVETPGSPEILRLRARALGKSGRTPEARGAYKDLVSAAPRDVDAYRAAAMFYAENESWDEAIGILQFVPANDAKLSHEIRLAVLRTGLPLVPWASIAPLFTAVDADETDPTDKRSLAAYREVFTAEPAQRLLKVLDCLDSDPQDHLNVRILFANGDVLPAQLKWEPGEGVVAPTLIKHVAPDFPDVARRARIEGHVLVLFRVARDGTVSSAHAVTSSLQLFERAAEKAVRRWRFTPATRRGEPIEVPRWAALKFTFR